MDKIKVNSNSSYQPRQLRTFSVELKKKLVEQIEKKAITVREVIILYKITETTVYRWLKEFSMAKRTNTKIVVESESSEFKVGKLLDRISELERFAGKKQLEIEYLQKVLELCSEELGYDAKKKFSIML